MERLVIVGASLAGLRAAQAARTSGFEGLLTVVGDEPHLPYTRPPLSKELLHGAQGPEECALPHGTVTDIEWRLGVAAGGLDRTAHEVVLTDGARIAYDRVIIATGCRARPWRGPGAELAGVHTLRGLEDAVALRDALRPGARLLIVGAGFIGCEVAASARGRGVEVTLVDIAPFPMLPLGPELGERCAAMHRDRGVDVRLGTGVGDLGEEDGRVRTAVLSDGSELEVDAVLFALGALPNTEWLADSGLTVDPGVVCDATLTSVDDRDVLAAGDLAAWPHPLGGAAPVRVEHWTTAAEHGGLAGRNALLDPGDRTAHTAPPYFWSDQYETKIQAVGFPARAERLEIVETSEDGARLVALGAHDGRVVAAVAFSAAKRVAKLRRRLAAPPAPRFEELRAELAEDPGRLGAPAAVEVAR